MSEPPQSPASGPDLPQPATGTAGPSVRLAGERALEHLIVRASLRVMALAIILVLAVELAWRLRLLLLLLAVAAFITAILYPIVGLLTRRGVGRTGAIFIVYAALALVAGSIGYLLFHPVYTSATHFAQQLPTLVRQAQDGRGQVGRIVTKLHLASYVQQHAPTLRADITKLGKPALAVGKTVVSGVASLVTIIFMSFFLLLEGPAVARGALRQIEPHRAEMIRRIAHAMTRQVAGFMLGDFATSIVAGIVVYVSLRVTNVPFATVLAIWVALVDFLPLVGGLLGGVAAIGVAFLHSLSAGIVTIIVFLVYQQIENHFLNPVIISRTVRLNPLGVLVAVLLGAETGSIIGSTFGAMCGAIFAVPLAGAIQVTARELVASREARRLQLQGSD